MPLHKILYIFPSKVSEENPNLFSVADQSIKTLEHSIEPVLDYPFVINFIILRRSDIKLL